MKLIGRLRSLVHCSFRSESAKRCLLSVTVVAGFLATPFLYPSKPAFNTTDVFYKPFLFTPLTNDTDPSDLYPLNQLPPEDRHLLINVSDFDFSVRPAPSRDCLTRRPLVLALIHTAPGNYERRALIRNTWLSRRHNQFVALFMIGAATDSLTRVILRRETERYGDLVQGNFVDSYRNMTYKHVMTLKYAAYHCPGARYVVKTDDDIVVNVDYLQKVFERMSPFGVRDLLVCAKRANLKVSRSYRSKWRVSYREFPSYSYPEYCSGGAVVYSPDVVFRIYKEVQHLPFFWIDDVHVTGTAAAAARVRQMHFLPNRSPFWHL